MVVCNIIIDVFLHWNEDANIVGLFSKLHLSKIFLLDFNHALALQQFKRLCYAYETFNMFESQQSFVVWCRVIINIIIDCHSKPNPRITSVQESRSLMENPTAVQLFKSQVRKVVLSTFSYPFKRLTI